MEFRYLTETEILALHSLIIEGTTGSHGVRDLGLLRSAVMRPQMTVGGADAFKDVFEKAAVYVDSIAKNHFFVDGNKRTAFVASSRFLYVNGYNLRASEGEVVAFMLRVIEERLDIQAIAGWLREHSQKRSTQ